jgi:hypothetical protein
MGYSSQLGFELGIGDDPCESVAQNLETIGRNPRGATIDLSSVSRVEH